MSDRNDKNFPTEEVETHSREKNDVKDSDALDSFLSRESASVKPKKSSVSKRGRHIAILLIAAGAVLVLVGMIFLLRQNPKPDEEADILSEAWTIATVDEAGMHVVEVPTDSEGNPSQNGYGTLLDYNPFLISEIRVENSYGSFTIHARSDGGETPVYQLEGYESFELQTGMPDNVANDAKDLHFLTIAGVGKNPADYGLSAPRARVYVTYTDGTSALINVGDEAPGGAGTYISFGGGESVFLVSDESVDAFFYSPAAFISLTITETPDSTDSAAFRRITLTGSRYPQKIVLEPNDDEAVGYYYRTTSPSDSFADAVMSANIAGTIRDLYADEVVAVNTGGADEASFLTPFGLGEDCYAEVVAEYPDATLHLRAGEPDSDGNVCLVNMDDPRIVYRIGLGSVGWAAASPELLAPDTVLRVSRTALDSITLISGEKTCIIDVNTRTQTVETTDGGSEEITTTEAYLDDALLGDDSFTILLQNLVEMKNNGSSDAPAETALLEIRYAYTTGRAADTIILYDSDGQNCSVALNGVVIGSVAKTYATALVGNMDDILAGKLPKSL